MSMKKSVFLNFNLWSFFCSIASTATVGVNAIVNCKEMYLELTFILKKLTKIKAYESVNQFLIIKLLSDQTDKQIYSFIYCPHHQSCPKE